MPSRGQKGGAMNDILDQQSAQTPSPSTGSRQATQSVGSATFSASRDICDHAPRQTFSAPRRCGAIDRELEGSAAMNCEASVGPDCAQAARLRPTSRVAVLSGPLRIATCKILFA